MPAPKSASKRVRCGARASRADWALLALGADPAFVDAVLGDLAEEYALRAVYGNVGAARWWYAREVLRSAPHLVRSAAWHAAGRTRLAAYVAGLGLTTCLALLWRLAGTGPPERLVAGVRDTVVVNHLRPVPLPTRVLDAAGRALPDTGVRYTWTGGAPTAVSARGVVTCTRPGDAAVRASLGTLATTVLLRCRPVREVRATIWNDFVFGDSARELPAEFVGVDGRPVTLLSARVSVADSTVATLDGLRIRPLRPGRTHLSLAVGNRSTGAAIRVFAPVRALEALRADQRIVAAPVRLARGASVRWPLPVGLISLMFLPDRAAPQATSPAPRLTVDGPIMCVPAPGPRVYNARCLVRAPGATVTVAHPGTTPREVVGALGLVREESR